MPDYEKLIEQLEAYGKSIAPYSADGDTVLKAAEAISTLLKVLKRIETGECVTDWADQPHEQMQEEARKALST
jgi:hypothetical protein